MNKKRTGQARGAPRAWPVRFLFIKESLLFAGDKRL
jgi:hypothetical protein